MAKRLAVARFWYQGNAFSPLATGLDSFRRHEWTEGREALDSAVGTDAELAAVADFAASRPDWDVTVLRCASANPAGPIEEPVFAAILDEVVSGLASKGAHWDAVYLSLHGAAITSQREMADLDLVRSVRSAAGDVPLAASFDLQANMNPEMASLLDFASAARTFPVTDRQCTAARVLDRLAAIASGRSRPRGAVVRTRLLHSNLALRTDTGPMAEVVAEARAATVSPVLDISALGGFPHADAPQCTASALAYAEDDFEAAHRAALRVAQAIKGRRDEFRVALPGPNQALHEALRAPPGLVAVTEVSDDPLSGGCADASGLFRPLLDLMPEVPSVFAYFADSASVARCVQTGVGSALNIQLGAKTSRDFGAGVQVKATVIRVTDGRFRNRGPIQFGMPVNFGTTVVLDVSGIKVVVTERCQPAHDPAFFELHGIDLSATRLLCVKAAQHFRVAFEPLCARVVDCNALGPASIDLAGLPFRNVRPDAPT